MPRAPGDRAPDLLALLRSLQGSSAQDPAPRSVPRCALRSSGTPKPKNGAAQFHDRHALPDQPVAGDGSTGQRRVGPGPRIPAPGGGPAGGALHPHGAGFLWLLHPGHHAELHPLQEAGALARPVQRVHRVGRLAREGQGFLPGARSRKLQGLLRPGEPGGRGAAAHSPSRADASVLSSPDNSPRIALAARLPYSVPEGHRDDLMVRFCLKSHSFRNRL